MPRQAERAAEGIALRLGQSLEAREHRCPELMESREGQLHLGVDPGRASDAEIVGRPGCVLEERRLPNARLASHHEHAALARPDAIEHAIDRRTLIAAATQHRSVADAGQGGHGSSTRTRPAILQETMTAITNGTSDGTNHP
jgi:hypothetical protein